MPHSHSACPICSTIIQDPTKEECDKCGWILKTEDLLDPRIYNLLLDWAIEYYERVRELEGRGKYRQDLLNKRLYTHRSDIDRLQQQLESIYTYLPEIKSMLSSKETNIYRDDRIPVSASTSIDNLEQDSNLPAPEPKETPIIDKYDQIPAKKELDLEAPELTKSQQDIVSEYYHNLSQFSNKYQVKTANITKDSISSNRGNEEKIVILEETNRGNYWIFNFEDCNYLVPVEGKYINQHSYTTTSTIFEGHNYTPDYQKIQLIKPAIVSIDPHTNPQTWRLQQQGELIFL
jgi:hypothetical protein